MLSEAQNPSIVYVEDMLRFILKVFDYTRDLDQDGFVANGLVYDATLRNLELIGEAASKIGDDIRREHSTIPWRMIVATRNRLIHGYLGIDNDTVWSIIRDDLPTLHSELLVLLFLLRTEPPRDTSA